MGFQQRPAHTMGNKPSRNQYINLFLERTDSVNWAQDAVIKEDSRNASAVGLRTQSIVHVQSAPRSCRLDQ